MARKSRKNIMPQSAAPEIRISEEVNLLRTAAYQIPLNPDWKDAAQIVEK